jgi:hypothetical protein
MNDVGQCHTCGTGDPGTKSGNFVPDHQPPTGINASGQPQRLYPQCLNCSRQQGGQVRGQQQKQQQDQSAQWSIVRPSQTRPFSGWNSLDLLQLTFGGSRGETAYVPFYDIYEGGGGPTPVVTSTIRYDDIQ